MIKYILLDYDRTLVNNNKELTKDTKEILIEIQKKGITLIIGTGRPFSGVKHIIEELQMDKYEGYAITCNGADISTADKFKTFYTNNFSSDEIEEIHSKVKDIDIVKGIYNSNNELVATSFNNDINDEATSNRLSLNTKGNIITDSPKYLLSESRETMDKRYEQVINVLDESLYNIVRSSPRYIEITKLGSDKGLALKTLMNKIGDSCDKVIGFGDSGNDITMMKESGVSVAMGNSTKEVIEMSDYVTDTNEEDGIATFIKAHMDMFDLKK